MMADNKAFVSLAQEALNIILTREQGKQFDEYRKLLLEWNQRLNLTAVRTPDDIDKVHFLDSLSCILVTGSLDKQTVVDVGTGAGFPGIPLKILFPTMSLTLIESVQKKAKFLETVVSQLGLDGVQIVPKRAEDAARDSEHRERYNWVMARAVADLRVLLEYLSPFCRVNGSILAMKGPLVRKEIEAAQAALVALQTEVVTLKKVSQQISEDKSRYLLKLKKVAALSDRYPRRAGVPGKRPL